MLETIAAIAVPAAPPANGDVTRLMAEALQPFAWVGRNIPQEVADGEFTGVEAEMTHEQDATVRADLGLAPTPPERKRTSFCLSLDGLSAKDWRRAAEVAAMWSQPTALVGDGEGI